MNQALARLITGGGERRSRLHDEKGNRIDLPGLLYAPRALATSIARVVFDYRPAMPWLSYRFIRWLSRSITKEWCVLEFGSGMSTVWLAERCQYILSVEQNQMWYMIVNERLGAKRIATVDYRLRDPDDFTSPLNVRNMRFDFALIDGIRRPDSLRLAFPLMKSPGWVYLDNSDKGSVEGRAAESVLRKETAARHGQISQFVDFSPGSFFASEGLLASL